MYREWGEPPRRRDYGISTRLRTPNDDHRDATVKAGAFFPMTAKSSGPEHRHPKPNVPVIWWTQRASSALQEMFSRH
jgi:hypothetical protein